MTHPNTTAAVITSMIAAGILRIAHHYGYAHMTTEEALAVTGGAISAVLFVGRRGLKAILVDGIRGVLVTAWKGSPKAPQAPVEPTSSA